MDSQTTCPPVLEVLSSVLLTHAAFLREKVGKWARAEIRIITPRWVPVPKPVPLCYYLQDTSLRGSVETASLPPQSNQEWIKTWSFHLQRKQMFLVPSCSQQKSERVVQDVGRQFWAISPSSVGHSQQWQFPYQSTGKHAHAADLWLWVFFCPDASSSPCSVKRAVVCSSRHHTSAQKWAIRC